MGKVIVVSGSVGSGKTTLAKLLAKRLHAHYVDVKKIITQHPEVVEGYDRKRKTKEVNVTKLNKLLIGMIKKTKQSLVIDSHLSHYLPKKYVDLCIICKCNLKELKRRLEKRKYHAEKVRGNLDAEIFDVCFIEAEEKEHKIVIVETDKRVDWQIHKIIDKLN